MLVTLCFLGVTEFRGKGSDKFALLKPKKGRNAFPFMTTFYFL